MNSRYNLLYWITWKIQRFTLTTFYFYKRHNRFHGPGKSQNSSRFSYHCIHTCARVWSPSFAEVSNHKFIHDKFIRLSLQRSRPKANNERNNYTKKKHKNFCSPILLDLLIILNENWQLYTANRPLKWINAIYNKKNPSTLCVTFIGY